MSKYEPGQEMSQGSKHECGKCYRCSRLKPLSFALAAGIVCALGTMLLGWSAASNHWGLPMVQVVASVYKGFAPTMTGSLWGGLWGFLDGIISGLIFAWIYNCCLCCRSCGYKK